MKRLKNFLLLFLLLASLMPPSHAQDVTTQGTEFWVSFMSNGYKDRWDETWLRIQLLISAKDACSCTITNPRTGWQRSFDLEANSAYLLDEIEEQQAYIEMYEAEMVMDKGLLITATDTVSVYCSNIAVFSFDVSYVMPTESLSDDYIIQTPDQTNNRDIETSAFLIVATEDNTTIDITPACSTLRERPAGETFTITMDKGQCFQVRSNKNYTESRDLSGSRVTARDCKKIAVFNGSVIIRFRLRFRTGYARPFLGKAFYRHLFLRPRPRLCENHFIDRQQRNPQKRPTALHFKRHPVIHIPNKQQREILLFGSQRKLCRASLQHECSQSQHRCSLHGLDCPGGTTHQ